MQPTITLAANSQSIPLAPGVPVLGNLPKIFEVSSHVFRRIGE